MLIKEEGAIQVRDVKSLFDLINRSKKLGCDPNDMVSPSVFVRIAKVNGMGEKYDWKSNHLWSHYTTEKGRPITFPKNEDLKRILNILKPVLQELPISDSSWAYESNRGAVRFMWEVAKHNPNFIWKEDLKGFFPSISKHMVYKFLTYNMGWVKNVAAIVSSIVTVRGVLPQGTSVSPFLSNAIAASMHEELLGLSLSNGIKYVNYADDIYFYGTLSKEEDDKLWNDIKGNIKEIITKHGFKINYAKVKRQRVLLKVLSSVIKNGYVVPDSEMQSLMRAVMLNMLNPDKEATIDGVKATESMIRGKLSWLWSINKKWFESSFGKYVEKLKRWYPDTYGDISKIFPLEFREKFFDMEPEEEEIMIAVQESK